ncbi:MAG: hypothetical protein WAN35_10300 [Terracidiphilus sp.]
MSSVLVGWLRKLEPNGHGDPEPVFAARRVRLLTPAHPKGAPHPAGVGTGFRAAGALAGFEGALRALGWNMAARIAELGLTQGSLIDLAYRIRENDHAEYGGLEVEIAGIELV